MTKHADDRLLQQIASKDVSSPSFAPELDTARYLAEVEDCDLTEVQKEEFLRILWDIMCRFVDIGFECDVRPLFAEAEKNSSDEKS